MLSNTNSKQIYEGVCTILCGPFIPPPILKNVSIFDEHIGEHETVVLSPRTMFPAHIDLSILTVAAWEVSVNHNTLSNTTSALSEPERNRSTETCYPRE